MKQKDTELNKILPSGIKEIFIKLGEDIRLARKRRKWTMEVMASRMFVTRQTLSRLENGDPGISLGVLALALWTLGLEKELFKLAKPEDDKVGIFYERRNMPERVRKKSKDKKLDF